MFEIFIGQFYLMIKKLYNRSSNKTTISWLTLIGCIINMAIIEGMLFNYPNLFNLVQNEFKVQSRLISSLPTTFLLFFFLLVSPASVFLTKTFGARKVSLIGSIISFISLVICSFQNSMNGFIVSYGVLTGNFAIN